MKMFKDDNSLRGISHTVCCLVLAMGLISGGYNAVAASDIDVLAKQTDKQLREAERNMHSGKNQEAQELLEQAGKGIEDLKSSAPGNNKIKSLEGKYARTKKALDRKLNQQSSRQDASPPPSPSAVAAGSSEKLPGGVGKRLRDITRELDNLEQALAGQRVANARNKYEQAGECFNEIEQQYSGKFSPEHPEFKAVADRYAADGKKIEQAANEQAVAAAAVAASEQELKEKADLWLNKFAPYMSASYYPAGHIPSKPIIYPGSSQPELYPEAEKRYEELKKIYADFQQAGFPEEKPWPLQQAAADVQYALDNYVSSMKSSVASITGDAEKNIEQAMAQLQKNKEWENDVKKMPNLVDGKWMTSIQSMVDRVAQALPAGDPRLVTLEKNFQDLQELDKKHRVLRAERRFVQPEQYKGKDLKDLQLEARRIVANERNNAKVLQVSIYDSDWKEERVEEFTDTTKTAIRYRVTRMINAQVAAKQGDGVMLHTIHLAKDMQGNSWGKLYGHIMYSDPMAAGNVGKKGP